MDWINIKDALPIDGYLCLAWDGKTIPFVVEYKECFGFSFEVKYWTLITLPGEN